MTEIEQAEKHLEKDGVIIFPTETTYALGCRIDSPKAIAKLYQIKGRPANQPTSIVCASLTQVKKYCQLTEQELKLAESFWPGPLTLCLEAKNTVPKTILGPDRTVGVRVPSFPWLKNFLRVLDVALLSPSANFRGALPPRKMVEIDKELVNLVDYVVNIEPEGKKPSTIVKLEGALVKVIRSGEIEKNKIEAKLKGVLI